MCREDDDDAAAQGCATLVGAGAAGSNRNNTSPLGQLPGETCNLADIVFATRIYHNSWLHSQNAAIGGKITTRVRRYHNLPNQMLLQVMGNLAHISVIIPNL